MSLLLDHEEFVRRYRANEVRCLLDKSVAMHVCDQVKEAGGCVHQSTKAVGCLLPLVGIVMLFFSWPVGVLCIFIGMVTCSAMRTTAGQNVVALALKDPVFYESLLERGVLTVREVDFRVSPPVPPPLPKAVMVYVYDNGEQSGPFSMTRVRELQQAFKISPGAYVCREGDNDWTPLSECRW